MVRTEGSGSIRFSASGSPSYFKDDTLQMFALQWITTVDQCSVQYFLRPFPIPKQSLAAPRTKLTA